MQNLLSWWNTKFTRASATRRKFALCVQDLRDLFEGVLQAQKKTVDINNLEDKVFRVIKE
jgi:hypothetical protein